jgi:hypothetical protein
MRHVPYARKKRQLKLLVKQLKTLISQPNALVQVRNLVIKIRTLSLELSKKLGTFQLKRILGPAAIILGISFSNPMAAQSFATPVANPFGLDKSIAPLLEYVIFPELADIDNDGDYDILAGSYSQMYYFENTGSVTDPVFGPPQAGLFGLTTIEEYSAPSLADLDADGDLDLMVINIYGNVDYFENTGTAEAAQFGEAISDPFGLNFMPATEDTYLIAMDFVDLDGDGDLDIMTGDGAAYAEYDYNSNLKYYENIGTAEAPQFVAAQLNPFGLSAIPTLGVSPEFLDMDDDGDMDIIVKDFYGGDFLFAENTGTVNAPAFEAYETNPFELSATTQYGSVMTSADMDNDGDIDLLVTQYAESISENPVLYIENTTISVSVSAPAFESNISPNPVQDWLKIDSEKELTSIQVFDIVGRSISLITNIESSIYLGDLDSGIYLLELTSVDGKRVSKKIEKL